MKQNFSIFLVIFSLIFGNIYTTSAQSSGKNFSAEQSCLEILNESIKSDNRFSGTDLEKVEVIGTNTKKNLTIYNPSNTKDGFHSAAEKKPNGSTLYRANRNNIGTIRLEDQYLITEFVPFGETTSFNFPYSTSSDPKVDQYGHNFREKIIYTHHLINKNNDKGKFVSCGFLQITPKNGFDHKDTIAANYKTNFLDSSGFEVVDPSKKDGKGNEFLIGRVNVPIRNYNNEHHMSIELITVAYNNKSKYFNEFDTFPLQVKAMTDEDGKGNVNSVQERFLQYVKKGTCLMAIHPKKDTLPKACGGEFQSGTGKDILPPDTKKTLSQTFFDTLIPKAFAEEVDQNIQVTPEESDSDKDEEDYSHLPRGMQIREGFSYENMEKINALNNPLLKEHILKALSDGVEKEMEQNIEGDSNVAHDNRVFLQCGMNYETRAKLLNEWLDSVDVNTFDINNITYPDPKIGDCIIPYPDARHKDKIIENSFLTNQYYAAVATNNTEKIEELGKKVQLGKYSTTNIVQANTNNNLLFLIVGVFLLVGGVALTIFLLRKKK